MDYKIPLSLLKYDQLSNQENYQYKFKSYTDEELDAIEIKNLPKYDRKKIFKNQSQVISDMQFAIKKTIEANDIMSQRKPTSSSKRQLLGPKVFEFKDTDTKSKLLTPATATTGQSQTPIQVSSQILVQNQEEQVMSQLSSDLHTSKIKNQVGIHDELEQYASILQDIDTKELEGLCNQDDQSIYLLSQMDQAKEALNEAFKKVLDWSESQYDDAYQITQEELDNISRKEEIKKHLTEIVRGLEDDINRQQRVNEIIKNHIKEDEKSIKVIFPDFNQEEAENYDLSDQSIIMGQDTKDKIGQLQQNLPKQHAKQEQQQENFTTPERRSFVYQMKQKEQEEYNQLIEQQNRQRLQDQQRVIDSLENNNQPLLLRKSLLELQMEGQGSNMRSIQRDDREENVIDVREKMQGHDRRGQIEKNQALQDFINREEQLLLLLKELTGILIEYEEENRIYTLRSKKDDTKYMTYQAEVDFKHILLITNKTRQRIPCTSHTKVKEIICSYFCKQ